MLTFSQNDHLIFKNLKKIVLRWHHSHLRNGTLTTLVKGQICHIQYGRQAAMHHISIQYINATMLTQSGVTLLCVCRGGQKLIKLGPACVSGMLALARVISVCKTLLSLMLWSSLRSSHRSRWAGLHWWGSGVAVGKRLS